MSQTDVIASLTRAMRNSALISRHGNRHYGAVLCLVRLADIEQMAGSLGPAMADLAISDFTARLASALRDTDEMIQLSPRRWAVILKGVSGEDHLTLALARIERQFAEPVELLNQTIMLRVNLGYAVASTENQRAEEVFWHAEESLTEARSQGRMVVRDVNSDIKRDQHEWSLKQALQRALDEGAFTLHFQPKINARFSQVSGAEALVRWHDRHRGIVQPSEFIETLEATELAVPFTHFVIKHALAQAAQWPGTLSVAVNIPPSVLADPGLSLVIADALAIFDVEPQRLCLEVTEGSVMRDLDSAITRLQALKNLGLTISIDDFGTGHSSLAHLRNLPLTELKIDRSFVADLGSQPKLVQYIIDLAHALELSVVAEGVENRAAMAQLISMGADYLQGYHISKPLPQAEFIRWLHGQGVR